MNVRVEGSQPKIPGEGILPVLGRLWDGWSLKVLSCMSQFATQNKKQVRERRGCVVGRDNGGCFCSVASPQRSLFREFLSAGQEKVKAQVFSSGPPRLFCHWKPNLKCLTSKDFLVFSFRSDTPDTMFQDLLFHGYYWRLYFYLLQFNLECFRTFYRWKFNQRSLTWQGLKHYWSRL